MKNRLQNTLLAFALAFACGQAQAAPPSTEQVDKLLQAMDAQKMIDQMIPAMMEQSRTMVGQMLAGENADAEARRRAEEIMAAQEAPLREMMSWQKLKPIYVRVYSDTLTDKEAVAMTAFYESPEGRSVMQKMPLILQRAMTEMQPVMQQAMQKMTRDIKTSIEAEQDTGKNKKK